MQSIQTADLPVKASLSNVALPMSSASSASEQEQAELTALRERKQIVEEKMDHLKKVRAHSSAMLGLLHVTPSDDAVHIVQAQFTRWRCRCRCCTENSVEKTSTWRSDWKRDCCHSFEVTLMMLFFAHTHL